MIYLPEKYQPKLPDIGRQEVDELLDDLIAEIESVYGQAADEMTQKAENYLQWFVEEDKKQREKFNKGEITLQEYRNWRQRKLLEGQRWYAMSTTLSNDLASSTAKAYSIINGFMPEAYALSGNWTAYVIEHTLKVETYFTLYNAVAIERLLRDKPDLLPKAKLDIPAELRWNKQHLTSAVMQSILQGESIPQLAKRLGNITDMNKNAAIRNARTMMTSAENGGIFDEHVRAQKMGIKLRHMWEAVLDFRTRDSHRHLDGEIVEVGEKFSNGLTMPGDPNGSPGEVCNCRCKLRSLVPHQDLSKLERKDKLGGMPYDVWKNAHGDEPQFRMARNEKNDRKMHEEYRKLMGNKVPSKFSDFQDIKYNNKEKWDEMKKAARIARNKKRGVENGK